MKANGTVFKYGDNVDTDVIIPARYLNSSDPAELAKHCMEDIDPSFISRVHPGDIIVADNPPICNRILDGMTDKSPAHSRCAGLLVKEIS